MAATHSSYKLLPTRYKLAPTRTRQKPGARVSAPSPPPKVRGRPRGINRERRRALVELVGAGLTLAKIAAEIGVSRQCIHQQLAKCPDINIERRVRRHVRRRLERHRRLQERGLRWAEKAGHGGTALAKFLREAMARGWP